MSYTTTLTSLNKWIAMAGLLMAASVSLTATGPRITAAMFTEAKNEMVAVEAPPLYAMQQPGGGLVFEIVSAALKTQNETATLTTYPVRKMADYYLTQEKVLGAFGNSQSLSLEAKKGNMVFPVCRVHEHYYYYKPLHPKGIAWKGSLSDLKGLRYGTGEEEKTAAYEKAGVRVERERSLDNFKKLKAGSIDFVKEPELTARLMMETNFGADKNQFGTMEPSPEESTELIVFNAKNPDAKVIAKKFRDGLNAILENGQYQAIVEKYEGKNELSNEHVNQFKTLWKKELTKK